jgi:hypothetical protein
MHKDRAALSDDQDESTQSLPSGGIRHEFMAWLPRGVAGPKMQAFITEQDAQILEADPDYMRLQIGQVRWLPWSRHGDDVPVEVVIHLNHETPCARSLTHVIAELQPLANAVPETLRPRLGQLLRALRYCLVAQELELE